MVPKRQKGRLTIGNTSSKNRRLVNSVCYRPGTVPDANPGFPFHGTDAGFVFRELVGIDISVKSWLSSITGTPGGSRVDRKSGLFNIFNLPGRFVLSTAKIRSQADHFVFGRQSRFCRD